MQEWEELGCYTTPRGHIRCTCATDFCNAPFSGEGKRLGDLGGPRTSSASATSPAASIALSFVGLALTIVRNRNVLFRDEVVSVQ